MEVVWLVFFTLFGAATGSFLNVCIDRLPAGNSLAYPPSACDACRRRLAPWDMVPVISYLLLRGRCRYCGAHIPVRVLLVEILGAVLFAVTFWRYDLSVFSFVTIIFSCTFIIIMFIDLEHQLILNKVTYPAAIFTLVLLVLDSALPRIGLFGSSILMPDPSILSGVIGGAIGFTFFLLVLLIYPKGMGEGDVKLAGLIGLVTGFPLVFVALFIGIVTGGLVAVVLLITGRVGRKGLMPYGTFLSLGSIITMLWGNAILSWYMGFF